MPTTVYITEPMNEKRRMKNVLKNLIIFYKMKKAQKFIENKKLSMCVHTRTLLLIRSKNPACENAY